MPPKPPEPLTGLEGIKTRHAAARMPVMRRGSTLLWKDPATQGSAVIGYDAIEGFAETFEADNEFLFRAWADIATLLETVKNLQQAL